MINDNFTVDINGDKYDPAHAIYELSRMINTYRNPAEYTPDDGRYDEHMINVALRWSIGDGKAALNDACELLNDNDHLDDKDSKLLNVVKYLAMVITDPDGLSIQDKIKLLHFFEDEFDDKKTVARIVWSD